MGVRHRLRPSKDFTFPSLRCHGMKPAAQPLRDRAERGLDALAVVLTQIPQVRRVRSLAVTLALRQQSDPLVSLQQVFILIVRVAHSPCRRHRP